MHSGLIINKKLLLVIWGKVLLVRVISLLHWTLLLLLNARLSSCAGTISTPSPHQPATNTPLMVSSRELSQWVSPQQELTAMTLWHAYKWLDVQDNTFWNKRNHTLLSLWHIEWVIIQPLIILHFIDRKMREDNGRRRMILLLDWQSSLRVKIIRILLMSQNTETKSETKLLSHWKSARNINSHHWILCLMMFMISYHNIWLNKESNLEIIWENMLISMTFWKSFKNDYDVDLSIYWCDWCSSKIIYIFFDDY